MIHLKVIGEDKSKCGAAGVCVYAVTFVSCPDCWAASLEEDRNDRLE